MNLKMASIAAVMILVISGSGVAYCLSDHTDGLTPVEFFDVLDKLRNTQDFAVKLYSDELLYEGYDVFPGTAGGSLGLIFTDYARVYTDEDGRTVVSCGFTPVVGGRPPERGLEAIPVESDSLSYVVETLHRDMSYQGVYNLTYFRVSVSDGVLTYKEVPLLSPYATKEYDEEAKSLAWTHRCLYDYDREIYLVGNSDRMVPYAEDYAALVDGFEEFMKDGIKVRYSQETYIEESKDYVVAYLDSVRYAQGECCGYSIDDIERAIKDLRSDQILRIDDRGMRVDLTSEAKVAGFMVSVGCIVLGIASSFIPGGPIMGAIISASVDTIISLAMTGQVPDPASLMVSAISGAACGALHFASMAKNIALGSLINGATAVAYDAVSGKSFKEMVADGFGEAAAGALIGVLFKAPNHPVKERSVTDLGKASAVTRGKDGTSSKLTPAGKAGDQSSVNAMTVKATESMETNKSNLKDTQKASAKARAIREDILAHYGVQQNMVSSKLHADGKGMAVGKEVNIPSAKKDGSITTFESDGESIVARTVHPDGSVEIAVASGGKSMRIMETGSAGDHGAPGETYGKNVSDVSKGVKTVTAVIKSGSEDEKVAIFHFDPATKNPLSIRIVREAPDMGRPGPER